MSSGNRTCATYDCLRVSELDGPVTVNGTLTALDGVITSELFLTDGTTTTALLAGTSGGLGQIALGCVDTTTGDFTSFATFTCPNVGGTNPTLCIPGFAAEVGVAVGIVGYTADGCLVPGAGAIVDVVCEELVADPECVAALALAIINAIIADQGLLPPGPLAEPFCTAVENCLPDIFDDIAADITTPLGVAFCGAVDACLADVDFPTLLECADLTLGDTNALSFNLIGVCPPLTASKTKVKNIGAIPQAPCVAKLANGEKAEAIPPQPPAIAIVSRLAGDTTVPAGPDPFLIDTTALGLTPIYVLTTDDDTAYNIDITALAKTATGTIDVSIDGAPAVPFVLDGTAAVYQGQYLINNVGGTVLDLAVVPNFINGGAGSTILPYEAHASSQILAPFTVPAPLAIVLPLVVDNVVTFYMVNIPPSSNIAISVTATQELNTAVVTTSSQSVTNNVKSVNTQKKQLNIPHK